MSILVHDRYEQLHFDSMNTSHLLLSYRAIIFDKKNGRAMGMRLGEGKMENIQVLLKREFSQPRRQTKALTKREMFGDQTSSNIVW